MMREEIEGYTPRGYRFGGMWIYKDKTGADLGVVARFDKVTTNGKAEKSYRPFTINGDDLICKGFPQPRPLYGLDKLAQRPQAPVLVVEGERTADAAAKLFPDYVAVTSPNGSRSAGKADWSVLAGRDVTIWMDHDRAGAEYALDVTKHVPDARVVSVPDGFPDGWDLADAMPEGVTIEMLLGLLEDAVDLSKPDPAEALRKSAEAALTERERLVVKIRGLLAKTVAANCTEAEAASAAALAKTLIDEHGITEIDLAEIPTSDVEEDDTEEMLRESAKDIIACTDVLKLFEEEWKKQVAGEVKTAKTLYLVATSRLFDRAMSAAIKGPSSAGKSAIRKKALDYFPPEDIISFTTMSERALLYTEDDFCHKILSMGEAVGADEQSMQDYLLRELISEGILRYPVVVKSVGGTMVTQTIVKHGPVCFLVTTCRHKLNVENETRMLSLEIDDSSEQTAAVLNKLAEVEGFNIKPDGAACLRCRDYQRWLASGNCNVMVPYSLTLARLLSPTAVRLRRDFSQIILAIKSHALLHREHRAVDENGEIIANLADYAAVRELMSDVVAETSGTKVSPAIMKTVAAVRKVQAEAPVGGVTAQAVGKVLKLDKSAARRRLLSAQDLGLIRNMETRKFQPADWRAEAVEHDNTQELMPSVERLEEEWCEDA